MIYNIVLKHPFALLYFTQDNTVPSQCNILYFLFPFTTCFGLNRLSSGVLLKLLYCIECHSIHMYFNAI
jgi:hypothetical protein